MKSRIFTALCFCFLLLSVGCKEENDETAMEAKLSSECTYDERRTVETFDSEQGVVTFVSDLNVYTISGGKPSGNIPSSLLLPCNLPEAFKKDKLRVIFSGESKEVYATEYWVGQPFKLTKLKADAN